MRKQILVFSLFCLVIISASSQEGTKNFIDQNYIEVNGVAEREIIPNEIYLAIIIDEKDSKGKENLEKLQNDMIKKFTEIGIDVEKDLSVVDFVSNFKNYVLKKTEIFTSKKFQLICHSSKMVAQVFNELEKLGISNITIERLDHSDIEEYRKQVKVEAIKAAKNKATYLLTAIGHNTGKAIYVKEVTNMPYVRREMMYANYKMESSVSKDKSYNEPEFEKINLKYEMLVRFSIE